MLKALSAKPCVHSGCRCSSVPRRDVVSRYRDVVPRYRDVDPRYRTRGGVEGAEHNSRYVYCSGGLQMSILNPKCELVWQKLAQNL